MEHSRENLELHAHMNQNKSDAPAEEKGGYAPRPKHQIVLAWIGIVVVVLGFLGTCYWMVNY